MFDACRAHLRIPAADPGVWWRMSNLELVSLVFAAFPQFAALGTLVPDN